MINLTALRNIPMVNKTTFFLKKYSPEILMGIGVTSIVTGTVLACKATLKASDILADLNKELEAPHELHEKVKKGEVKEERYPEIAYRKEVIGDYAKYSLKFAKLYAPAVALVVLGIASMLKSNNILRGRCASLSAAYLAVDTAFKNYRKNVVEKYGEDVDKELRYGVKKEKIEVVETDENGKTKKVKKEVSVIDETGYSAYARYFDDSCGYYQSDPSGRPCTDYNLFFLKAREAEATTRLRADGYLFLNDVYKMLGIEPSLAGQSVGWIYDKTKPEDEQEGDGFVSFNIYKATRANARFIEGIEDVILLDFNVDGPIMDRLNGTLATI